MKNIYSVLTILFLTTNMASSQEKTLYVIDSIPYSQTMPFIKDLTTEDLLLYDDEIASRKIVTDSVEIKKMGFEDSDTVIVIETKGKLKRPTELNNIPNKKLFKIQNTFIYYKNAQKPYTGPYVDYNINGSLKERGYVNNGTIEGIVYKYDGMGRVKKEEDYKNGISARSYREFWPNGNIKTKVNYSYSPPNDYILYSSNGKRIKVVNKKITDFIEEQDFQNKNNYQKFLNSFQSNNYRINEKSYASFLYLGTSLFYYGEVKLAIRILDSAIIREPLDIDSRVCRLYCTIFKYENKKPTSIKPIMDDYTFAPIDSSSVSEMESDLKNICNDIHELKMQGYNHFFTYKYEDEDGNDINFFVSIVDAEKRYCTQKSEWRAPLLNSH